MPFISWIIARLSSVSSAFYQVYLEVLGWVWPFWYTATWFYSLSSLFASLAWDFYDFGQWVDDVWRRVQTILDSEGILGLLKWWFPWLEDVGLWFTGRWQWFITNVGDWWAATKLTVLGWIEIAKQLAKDLVANVQKELSQVHTSWDNFWTLTWPQWTSQFHSLATAWDNFWKVTFPTLITGGAVADLIDSTLKRWFPFYDELTALWGSIKEFIVNPLDWVAGKLEDWFWGGAA